jgi:ferrous iron transport protein A
MTIADLETGDKAIITKVDLNHPSSYRILEYGFTPGQYIEIVNKSIFKDPIAVSLRGTLIAIRKNDALCIEVEKN